LTSSSLVALLKSEIFACECFWCPTILEIENNSLIGAWVSNEAHYLVTNLVKVLNAWSIKSVVLDSGKIPWSILWSLVRETIEKPID
jgi:hypothetical protein